MLLIDSWYSTFRGVVLLIRVFDGTIKAGYHVVSFATGLKYHVGEVGIMYPDQTPQTNLRAGQLGYIFFNPGMKQSKEAKLGDTYTTVGSEKSVEALPGFEEPKTMVFVAAFPTDQVSFSSPKSPGLNVFGSHDTCSGALILQTHISQLQALRHPERVIADWRISLRASMATSRTALTRSRLMIEVLPYRKSTPKPWAPDGDWDS